MFGLPRLWLALALSAALAAVWLHGRHTGVQIANARHSTALVAAQAEAAAKGRVLAQKVIKAAEDAYNEQVETEKRLALADDAVDRLREAVGSANQRAGAATAAAADGAAARTLLADCAGKYRDLARDADRLRAIVIGLQGYARGVSQ